MEDWRPVSGKPIARTLLFSSDKASFQWRAAMIVPSGNGSVPSKGLYRNVVAQLSTHLFQFISCQVIDGDQTPITVSGRNCDAVDRRCIALSLRLALLGALCRGFRDVESANGDSGANAECSENLCSRPEYHDLLPALP